MCVAAIAWRAHPRWQLVAIGNRDELHARPTAPLARWDNGILAGRDLQAGGTWLGVSGAGRFALVTNRRVEGFPLPGMASRGALVTDWLLDQPGGDPAAMNPFNLFAVGAEEARLLTNYPIPADMPLAPGIHGLSNGALDDRWSKTARLETALAQWLDGADQPASLLAALADETCDPLDAGNPFSAPFIRHDNYGTRCSTVVAVDQAGCGAIIERSFDASGAATGEIALDFRWPAQP